jgi:LysM repeat protein
MRDHVQPKYAIFYLLLLALILVFPAYAQDESGDDILPITGDVNYEVRVADTLDKIGALFDVKAECIAEHNDIKNGGQIKVGDTLKITVDCPPYDGELAVGAVREVVTYVDPCADGYMVQENDTLDVIGQALDVSVVSLQVANDIQTQRDMEIGMCLTIPEDAPPYGVYPALDNPEEGIGGGVDGELYVIQPLDTLDVIGQRFNVSVVAIKQVNQILKTSQVTPGKTIVIPEGAPAYGQYPALCIDEAGIPVVETICDNPNIGQGGGGPADYVVQVNDTLDKIGALFNADVKCIAEQNELKNNFIRPGQPLTIGEDCPAYTGDLVIVPLENVVTPAEESSEGGGDG